MAQQEEFTRVNVMLCRRDAIFMPDNEGNM